MIVDQLWRYPVKSLRGEPLQRADVTLDGIAGDRIVHVQGPHGVITSRTKSPPPRTRRHPGAGRHPAHRRPAWGDERSRAAVREAAGADAELVAFDGPERFDIMPLLVATDGAITAFGRDGRRLRPNIVVGGVEGLTSATGRVDGCGIGDIVINLDSLRGRCIMTTFDPDTLKQDVDVLRDVNARFGGELALNAFAESAGTIAVGDHVELLP